MEDEDDDEDEVDRRGVGGGAGRREGGRVAVGHLRRLITFLTNLKLYSEISYEDYEYTETELQNEKWPG